LYIVVGWSRCISIGALTCLALEGAFLAHGSTGFGFGSK